MSFFCKNCKMMYNITKNVHNTERQNKTVGKIFDKFAQEEELTEKDLKGVKTSDLRNDDVFDKMNVKTQKKFIAQVKTVNKDLFTKENEKNEKIEQDEKEEEVVKKATLKGGLNNQHQIQKAFFICKTCNKHSEEIKPGTVLYSKNYDVLNSDNDNSDYSHMIHDDTLARTKNYLCKNKNCPSYKDDSLKEAVMPKNQVGQVIYVCCACTTSWTSSI